MRVSVGGYLNKRIQLLCSTRQRTQFTKRDILFNYGPDARVYTQKDRRFIKEQDGCTLKANNSKMQGKAGWKQMQAPLLSESMCLTFGFRQKSNGCKFKIAQIPRPHLNQMIGEHGRDQELLEARRPRSNVGIFPCM